MEPISDPRVITLINEYEWQWDYERVSEPQFAQDSSYPPLAMVDREGKYYANAA